MDTIIIVIRLVIVFVAALLFGLERQRSHKPVGFGTFIFVSMGAAALGLITISNIFESSIGLMAAVVTGIGFLGAGALIRGTDKVHGFTTAAAIWLFAIIGLVIGIGEYILGATLYSIVWVVVVFDKYLEIKGMGSYQRKLIIVTNKIIKEDKIREYLLNYTEKHKKMSVDISKEKNELNLVYLVEGTREKINKMVMEIFKEDWLKSCKVD